jgi:hypothetical protein
LQLVQSGLTATPISWRKRQSQLLDCLDHRPHAQFLIKNSKVLRLNLDLESAVLHGSTIGKAEAFYRNPENWNTEDAERTKAITTIPWITQENFYEYAVLQSKISLSVRSSNVTLFVLLFFS